ncbi:SNF2 family DNA or RNA helicase [Nocardioides albertanoniae]|uniref:SNF2 family DNA or RNA helicase n=1 Tax=Nocardioides albertanoniae TaxID=1175486 RepID=A0A543A4A3_9ACTN|nr:DEAD/DEAH box helicase [Nocardioides albertanoniae]TQL67420.1 SNF2 family DNA or RNA helicase [Nocardioides albertanoniae]
MAQGAATRRNNRSGRSRNNGNGSKSGQNGRRKGVHKDNEGIIPVLAQVVREVEASVQRRSAMPDVRTKFQVVALLARDERHRVLEDETLNEGRRAEQLKRLDGIATILAKTATLDSRLFELLAEDAEISDAALDLKHELMTRGGVDVPDDEEETEDETPVVVVPDKRVVPTSVLQRQLSNPFLTPDFTNARPPVHARRLAGWELLGPLFRSFEYADSGPSCMVLPEPPAYGPGHVDAPGTRELMHHQAQLVASAAEGHRSYLLADEPGLGKTAQALLAAEAADAYPLLVVVPNVVKTNWAREVSLWTPSKKATVVHGNGEDIDGFADIIVVNYEILDRHVRWLGDFGFKGMVVDEAHFIKNKSSQRSQHVLALSEKIRERAANPLLMALTGTPLINDIEDFRAIWQFLGWIDDVKPRGGLLEGLEETGMTPQDNSFYGAARRVVVNQGIVRRRKVDVASDIPARRVADLPVELDDAEGRSIRAAEAELAKRMVQRYDTAIETRVTGAKPAPGELDVDLIRRVATWEREDQDASTGENVFGMMRRIGRAKATLAADYAAQLARNVGKVVFFAKHIEVMDTAQKLFEERGIRYSTIRGDQTGKAREKAIEDFTNDPEVEVIVCSLTAAGVGVNLQAASNLILAELSWTDAEQTQAIDRVHRIGQTEPVTAWRIIASQTIDTRIAELIDSKAGLAARALDGSDEEVTDSADVQLEALVSLLTDALQKREAGRRGRRAA